MVNGIELCSSDLPRLGRGLPANARGALLGGGRPDVQPDGGPERPRGEPDDPVGTVGFRESLELSYARGDLLPAGAGGYGAPDAPEEVVVAGALPPPPPPPPTAPRIVTEGRLIRVGSAAAEPWTSATRVASSSRRAW